MFVEGFEVKPCADMNLSKKNNPWTKVCDRFTTNDELEVVFEGKHLKTDSGIVTTKSIKEALIS